MVVAGRELDGGDVAIMMVEAEATPETIELIAGGATAPTEDVVAAGLEAAKAPIAVLCAAQRELAAKAAKETGEFPLFLDYGQDLLEAVTAAVRTELAAALQIAGKQEREEELDRVAASPRSASPASFEGREKEIGAAYRSLTKTLVRERVIRDKVRIDGRGLTDIRALSAEVDVLPRVHGSALFERGETQILGVTTLAMLRMEQIIDTLNPDNRKRYMHNYNFPPYSTGETGRVGSPKRREIGHGALAERALLPVLPTREDFPYAIRQVSEALELQRVDQHGLGLREHDEPAQRRCAAEGSGRRYRDGADLRGRRVRHPDRHPRRRRRLRRHGLQGRRHEGLHHRAAARHQARRHSRRRCSAPRSSRRAGPG